MEDEYGNEKTRVDVDAKMPRVVKKRRRVEGEEGAMSAAWEEYFDYIFPDDESDKSNFKLLAMAHQWKMKMAQQKESQTAGQADEVVQEGERETQ